MAYVCRVLLLTPLLFLTACLILNVYDMQNEEPENDRSGRAAHHRTRRFVRERQLWPNATIPYVLDCSIENVAGAKRIIKAAMAEWEEKTCIRFVKRTNELGYLLIRRYQGCWGDVGYTGRRVIISMGDGCEFKYVMMHELGHVIGFFHEHNRPDRDSFIKVLWDNIFASMLRQFNKRNKMDKFDSELPYDFSSIMHYRFVAFAKNRSLETMDLINENSTETHDPYSHISPLDVQKTVTMYKCPIAKYRKYLPKKKRLNNKFTSNVIEAGPGIVKVVLKSSGVALNQAEDDSIASIRINGKEWAVNKPGLNIVLLNYLSGKPKVTTVYSIKRRRGGVTLARFIHNFPRRNYFLIVSKVSSFRNLRPAASALRSIGFHAGRIRPGSSLCFVGYKGNEALTTRQIVGSPSKNSATLALDLKVAKYFSCEDDLPDCQARAKQGHCKKHPLFLLPNCQKSCKICKAGKPCKDRNKLVCIKWAKWKMCRRRPKFMLRRCKVTCGICGKALPAMTNATSNQNTQVIGGHGKRTVVSKAAAIETKNGKKKKGNRKEEDNKEGEDKEDENDESKPRGVKCYDKSPTCETWSQDGRCDTDDWVYRNCLVSCNRTNMCDSDQVQPKGDCSNPFGIGWDRRLPDSAFNASSHLTTPGNWSAAASNARLYMDDNYDLKLIGSWCSQEPASKIEWLQIDLGRVKNITAVATQGRFRYYEHVKSYKLSFSMDGDEWWYYRNGRRLKIFEANCDHTTPVVNSFDRRIQARYVQFHPIYYFGLICMRVEIFGCD